MDNGDDILVEYAPEQVDELILLGRNDVLYTVTVETGTNDIDPKTLKPVVQTNTATASLQVKSRGSERNTHSVWCQIRDKSGNWSKRLPLRRSSNHSNAFSVSQVGQRVATC